VLVPEHRGAGSSAWTRSLTARIDTLLVHPREVFKFAISANAAAVVLAHNHPSGDPTPSEADIKVTRDLIRAGQLFENRGGGSRHHRPRHAGKAEGLRLAARAGIFLCVNESLAARNRPQTASSTQMSSSNSSQRKARPFNRSVTFSRRFCGALPEQRIFGGGKNSKAARRRVPDRRGGFPPNNAWRRFPLSFQFP